MRKLYYLLAIILALSCSSADNKKVNKPDIQTVETPDTLKKSTVDTTIFEFKVVDIDKNNILDTFSIKGFYEPYFADIILNSNRYRINYPGVFLDSISNSDFQKFNQIDSKYFLVFTTSDEDTLLCIKDKGGFEGPILMIYGINKGQLVKLHQTLRLDLIGLTKDSISTYLVTKELIFEPGYIKGYNVVDYPLFKLFELTNKDVLYDSMVSRDYNLKNNERFDEYLNMSNPVLGKKEGERIPYYLMDLDTVN
jgi:hypothetical protein